jgi:hypothetical protein
VSDFSYKTTVGELLAHHKDVGLAAPTFFRELIDTATSKCYGIQAIADAEWINLHHGRILGAWGKEIIRFERPFTLQRGHRLVDINASERKPITCAEHIYAQV